MALKKRPTKSKGEQLYMLEVFVDQLTLNPDVPNVKLEDLLVCVRFIDLPEYQINVSNEADDEDNPESSNQKNLDGSKFGKSCLFAKTPSCLIKAIRWSPLCLELHRKDANCSSRNGAFLGTAKISLPTCMCNQVVATQRKTEGLSTPCVMKDSFELTAPNGKATGSITVVLRLSCFGSTIIKQFSLSGKSFMLEDSPLQKFLCSYASSGSKKGDDDPGKPSLRRPDSPPRITMDNPAFKTLTQAEKLNDPKFRELVYTAFPDEPTCCCAPKDRAKHPMECPSGCNRACCMKLRDPKMLTTQENKRPASTLENTYCVNNFLSALHALKQHSPCGKQSRLRGGGDIEQIYVDTSGSRWTVYDADYTWCEEKNKDRLEGGGGETGGMTSCSCSGGTVLVPARKTTSQDNDVVTVFDACTPRITSTGATPTCVCPGKDQKFPRGAAKCMKSPCMGVDCLIRAFKDAQDFVDSIGKVPGLPGLGLMDPSESPYFGRDLDKDYVAPERVPEKKKAPAGSPQVAGPSAPTCNAPCSILGKATDDRSLVSPYMPPISRGITVPPRLGIVREAIPVLPEAGSTIASTKHRKKEDKKDEKTDKKEADGTSSGLMDTEVGPCGEPRCKSRRKKPADSGSGTQSATHVSSKTKTGAKRGGGQKARRKTKKTSKGGSKRRGPKARGVAARRSPTNNQPKDAPGALQKGIKGAGPQFDKTGEKGKALGPGGDRNFPSQQSIPVSKRVMRWVYFLGDYYPGTNYGHRNCIDVRMRVPANMGWLWNAMSTVGKLKPRIGWKPGAIGRYLYKMLQDAKENSFAMEEEYEAMERSERGRKGGGRGDRGKITAGRMDRGRGDKGRSEKVKITDRARSAPSRPKSGSRRQRTGRTMSYQSMQKQSKMEGEEEGPESPPTLHIHRKDGTYYVTMYPIRQETSAEPRLSEPMKPLQFKIVKNKDDASVASSSTASDMEIEFSPPAAITRHRKKPDVIHVETQVRQQEIIDTYKAEELKKKNRRGARREKKMKQSRTSLKK